MTSSTNEPTTTSPPHAHGGVRRRSTLKGVLAAVAAAGFFGTAVVAPLSMPSIALADEDFYERIHQQFVPEQSDIALDVSVSPLEQLPEPTPEPTPEPAQQAAARPAAPPMYTGGGSPAEWMAAAGIPESEWGYVDAIVSRESGWNPNATNASSGACGLVQAYPCSKVPGNGYDPVDNLRWGAGYAAGRYGGWAAAYEAWNRQHWW